MSLKKFIVILLIANVGYFGYTQGWMNALLNTDGAQREPERIKHQINSDAIEVTTLHEINAPAAVATIEMAPTPPPPPTDCTHEQWLVYMGPYPNQAASDKKKAELRRLGITNANFISKSSLKLGLNLGQFETEALARDELERLKAKGVKTATVLLWSTTVDCP